MGCDIHSFAEVKQEGKWQVVRDKIFGNKDSSSPFNWRSYNLFGVLAGVRDYAQVKPISEPKGAPSNLSTEVREELSSWEGDGHSHSWFTVRELLDFDWDKIVWNRRITRQEGPNFFNGRALAEEGEGKHETYREHIGPSFFEDLEVLKGLGDPEDVRVVFFFDN